MRRHVSARTESTLLLCTPQTNTHRPPGLQVELLKKPDNLQDHSRAGRIVGCSCSRVPGIETTFNHYHLILEISSRNLRDDVVAHRILIVETHVDVDFKLDGNTSAQHTDDAVVLLCRDDSLWDHFRLVWIPRLRTLVRRHLNWRRHRGPRYVDRPTVAASWFQYDGGAFRIEHLPL